MTPTEPARDAEVDELLEHLKVLRLEPGDVLVYSYPGSLSQAAAESIRKRFLEVFPGHLGIVLEDGATLGVVRRGEAQ